MAAAAHHPPGTSHALALLRLTSSARQSTLATCPVLHQPGRVTWVGTVPKAVAHTGLACMAMARWAATPLSLPPHPHSQSTLPGAWCSRATTFLSRRAHGKYPLLLNSQGWHRPSPSSCRTSPSPRLLLMGRPIAAAAAARCRMVLSIKLAVMMHRAHSVQFTLKRVILLDVMWVGSRWVVLQSFAHQAKRCLCLECIHAAVPAMLHFRLSGCFQHHRQNTHSPLA